VDKEKKKDIAAAYKERPRIGGICAVRNTVTGRVLISAVTDVEGYKNRFAFSLSTDSCVHPKLDADWKKYGGSAFELHILETLEKKETQTDLEFTIDIASLKELWLEKIDPATMY